MGDTLAKQLRYRSARMLRKIANRIATKRASDTITFPDIGLKKLGPKAPRALVIYTIAGIERYVRGTFDEHDPFFNKHTMYWESVELVRQLNAHGYVVDYADKRYPVALDWSRYPLIIDQWDTLRTIPSLPGIKKVHYTTYTHWLTANIAEHTRIRWFKERTGILVPWARTMPPIMSDLHADYLTYFGTPTQTHSFDQKPERHQLNISTVYTPEYRHKNIEKARKNFLWIGGGGIVHKGLDITMEAFAQVPDAHLYIAGNPQEEPEFWSWAQPFLAKNSNIHLLGWVDVASPTFNTIAHNCIGIIYPSCAEGGPGSVAQVLHWGLIPIVTPTAAVRAEKLGRTITGTTDTELISSTAAHVQALMDTSASELSDTSDAVIDLAKAIHTRSAYSESIQSLITRLIS